MGDQLVHADLSIERRSAFIRHLLDDIRALEIMLEKGQIESGINRIGAEQEFCLLNPLWRPANNAMELLDEIDDPHFTTELALYNLEINLDPLELKGDCFRRVEQQLQGLLNRAKEVAERYDTRILLTGILPTISLNELQLSYLTPKPRYLMLNNLMRETRGRDFELYLKGVDQLAVTLDTVLFEACNTSFQLHLQVSPEDFVSSYNWAQAISGPVLAACTNSPLLMGRELWSETRVALFQQSIDLRSSSYALKDKQARVTFGDRWVYESISEIYKYDISSYKILLTKEIEKSSLDVLEEGGVPRLEALNLHNGSIYRWNRACYGSGGGVPHVRIENRYIPSGPTVADEMANFAFWVGVMKGRPSSFDHMPQCMDFREAKANFFKAARTGLDSVMNWCGTHIPARELISEVLMPIAREGLKTCGVEAEDADYYLDIINQRMENGTGSQWSIRNYRRLTKEMKRDDALKVLTKNMYRNQLGGSPIHKWPIADEKLEASEAAHLVSHIMSTQLFTIKDEDLADLAVEVMRWNKIHHLPVEDRKGRLCGLLTWSHMEQFIHEEEFGRSLTVGDIMITDLYTVDPHEEIKAAIALMEEKQIGCLPVVMREHLVGIITQVDITHHIA